MARVVTLIHCPLCEADTLETMPLGHCMFFYECPHCHTVLRAKPGCCCVFCSYADVPCPPCQVENTCHEGVARAPDTQDLS
jgi:hypothetical protein